MSAPGALQMQDGPELGDCRFVVRRRETEDLVTAVVESNSARYNLCHTCSCARLEDRLHVHVGERVCTHTVCVRELPVGAVHRRRQVAHDMGSKMLSLRFGEGRVMKPGRGAWASHISWSGLMRHISHEEEPAKCGGADGHIKSIEREDQFSWSVRLCDRRPAAQGDDAVIVVVHGFARGHTSGPFGKKS